jgi:Family of unknown function (DUF6356)
MTLQALFTDHPRSVGETYGEHMRVALSFAGPLATAAAAALVHAFLPFLCVKTASQTIKSLSDRMNRRCAGCSKAALHRPDLVPAVNRPSPVSMSRLPEPDYVI